MTTSQDNVIKVGDYVVVQRWNFMKIVHFGGIKGTDFDIVLGNDIVNASSAVGKPYWSTFKIIPEAAVKKSKKRLYKAELLDSNENPTLSAEILKEMESGSDNRNIKDDGKSQTLSTANIHELRDSGTSANEIVEQLIENSTTFQKKTEFAQEKYLTKKKRKYFDYILLRPTSLRLMIEINNKKDPSKFLGISMDTLSHMITACNIQPGGNYLTYENGCSGLVSATILNYLDITGKVLQVHPGPFPQKSSVLSLNFSTEKLNNYVSVSARDMIDICKSLTTQTIVELPKIEPVLANGTETLVKEDMKMETVEPVLQNGAEIPVKEEVKMETVPLNIGNSDSLNSTGSSVLAADLEQCDLDAKQTSDNSKNGFKGNLKRKNSDTQLDSNKKSCYVSDPALKTQVESILTKKVDGLIIVCKEHPESVLKKFIKYVAPSRPIIIYSLYREPLVDLFMELKNTKLPVINVRLTESFLRTYQVLPDRTHPMMSMNSTGGYLLTATVVE
uniref:tRNA (adenine(58)-N(1))-methyltransferase non-catalytic subunit TRM6 n=1 Tax=Cacopsylla melanoneura TaxID=428564 RepID=A0A8D8ZZ89_9HEMI